MPEPESAIAPDENAVRIESATSGPVNRITKPTPRRRTTMAKTKPSTNGHSHQNGHAQPTAESIDVLIEKGEALKVTLRDSLFNDGGGHYRVEFVIAGTSTVRLGAPPMRSSSRARWVANAANAACRSGS